MIHLPVKKRACIALKGDAARTEKSAFMCLYGKTVSVKIPLCFDKRESGEANESAMSGTYPLWREIRRTRGFSDVSAFCA